jgi:hypothetical protein
MDIKHNQSIINIRHLLDTNDKGHHAEKIYALA